MTNSRHDSSRDLRQRPNVPRFSHASGKSPCAAPLVALIALLAISPTHAEPAVVFTDVTAAAGIDFVETIGDETMTNIVESAGVGCAVLDYDGDGWMDLYFVNGCWRKGLSDPALDPARRKTLAAATNRLYRNLGNGKFVDVTARAGLGGPADASPACDYGMGAAAVDYDGDGDTDLYVTNYGPNALYRNNGDGTFTDVASSAGVSVPDFSVGAAFFDYDRDGRLDLYVGNYVAYDPDYHLYYAPDGFPGPLAYTGQQDRLFHGNNDGTFTDVTRGSGIEIEPKGRTMGVGVIDYDDDGYPDLFVSNDAMENFLLHNNQDGTFTNRALSAGVAFGANGDATAAMGVEVGDYDGDGRFDLFVPDMAFSCLYHNTGRGFFEDTSVASGLAAAMGQYVGWGGVLADFDLDGRLDLYISNGDLHHLEPYEDVLLHGNSQGGFTDISETAGEWMARKYVGRGVAGLDFDNDGDVDLVVTNLNDRPALLRNDTPRRGRHWLSIQLVGRPPGEADKAGLRVGMSGNRDAIGAVVKVKVGKRVIMRHRPAGGGYLSQHDPRIHIGLGTHDAADSVEVIWPDGSRQVERNVPADKWLILRQRVTRAEETR